MKTGSQTPMPWDVSIGNSYYTPRTGLVLFLL